MTVDAGDQAPATGDIRRLLAQHEDIVHTTMQIQPRYPGSAAVDAM